jgi:hypothetical protein
LRSIARMLVLTMALATAAAMPAVAEGRFTTAISDQHASTFSHPLFKRLKIKQARLVVPWDALRRPYDTAAADAWLTAARLSRVQALVSFNHSRVSPRKLPSASQYRRAFQQFRKRYPWVKTISPWNEANHNSQPTYRKPKWAARYYNIVRSVCRSCKIIALDVLDQKDMVWYVRAFKRKARGALRIWGLHNYSDTNRFRSSGTKALLGTVRGQIWLTETGGVVKFARGFPYNIRRQARATRYMFRLARSNRRIKRLYIYSWKGEKRGARFDAGLVYPNGKPRPAYHVVRKTLRR